MMNDFYSPKMWRHPDVVGYEKQKKVYVIELNNERMVTADSPPAPEHLFGGVHGKNRWSRYYGPRMVMAVLGKNGRYATPFPGHTVPGLGGGKKVRYAGSLALERFLHLMQQLTGGFPIHGMKPREHHIESVAQLSDWPWKYVSEPKLSLLTPSHGELPVPEDGTSITMNWIQDQIKVMVSKEKMPTRELLTFVRKLWSPHTKAVIWEPETVEGAHDTLSYFKKSLGDSVNWLTLAFELEATFSRFENSWPHNVTTYGEYEGAWVEVGRLPISKIKQTELAVTHRVLQELVNIRTQGFAPIVVNEYGCNSDGTHRFLATWLWNLLQAVPWEPKLDSEEFQRSVGDYINEQKMLMGPIVVREALRVLSEFIREDEMRSGLKRDVIPFLGHFYPVTHLPVILLPEYSCGAVIKGPYDDGIAAMLVDPKVYEILSENPAFTLPARGPYHLTDRAVLPWFKVLEDR